MDRKHGGNAGAQLRSGFFFGIGFCLPLAFAWIAVAGTGIVIQKAAVFSQLTDKPFTPAAKLEIVAHEMERSGPNVMIRGQIANEGADSWRFVYVVADFYDDSGKFIWQCREGVHRTMLPGDTVNFVVDCRGSEDDRVPEFATYTVQVGDASFVRGDT